MLSEAEQARIAEAIAAAEAKTSGEIFCIYERKLEDADDNTRLLWSAGCALLIPPLLAAGELLLFNPWTAASAAGAEARAWELLTIFLFLQGACFAVAFGLLSIPAVRRWATPRAVKRARAHRAALQAFLARGLHITQDRTGVLIFVVEEDHQIEIVADEGIHSKVAPEVWGDAVAALAQGLKRGQAAEGFEAAIGLCAQVLAEHFPPGPDDRNELPNRIVVVD